MTIINLKSTKLLDKIRETEAKVVGLQFPEGLKVHATELAQPR